MRTRQFSLKTLLWLTAVVAVALFIGGKIGDYETERRRSALQAANVRREAERQAISSIFMNLKCGTK